MGVERTRAFAGSRDPDAPGRYLTDGERLFRLVEPFDHPGRGGVVGLEDCCSLDVVFVPAEEFARWALRSVHGPAHATASGCTPRCP